jgi:hypothetical protein
MLGIETVHLIVEGSVIFQYWRFDFRKPAARKKRAQLPLQAAFAHAFPQ